VPKDGPRLIKERFMNIKLLTTALAAALLASGAPAMAQGTRVIIEEQVWVPDTVVRYEVVPRYSYEVVPRYTYIDAMGRRWDADGNRIVSREVYVSDWRSRWDALDPDGRGASPAEVSRLTHNVDSSTSGMPMSGAGAQPGNMGPANSKGQ
jgi:hypothetical protein